MSRAPMLLSASSVRFLVAADAYEVRGQVVPIW